MPYPFVTRLRTELLIDHIYGDLVLAPAPDASWISNFIQVEASINEPPPIQCPDYDGDGNPDSWFDQAGSGSWSFGCASGGRAGLGAALLLLLAGLAAIVKRRFT